MQAAKANPKPALFSLFFVASRFHPWNSTSMFVIKFFERRDYKKKPSFQGEYSQISHSVDQTQTNQVKVC